MSIAQPAAVAPRRSLELAPDRVLRDKRQPYAVVDIGSNSVRLVVYDQLGRAPFPRFNEKSLCRLAEGLDETGVIADTGFRRTVEATRRFRAIADAMGVARIDVLATEATRRATNGAELVGAIGREAGLEVRVLTGTEEARYASLGVISGFYRPVGLVGDMGGGSLELAEIEDDRIGDRSVSLPLGALPTQALMARYGEAAKDRIDAILAEALSPPPARAVFYPVGGGWRALAKAHIQMTGAPVQVVHGYRIDVKTARDFAKSLWRMPDKALGKLKGVPARRGKTLAAAALVLDRVLKFAGPQEVVFSALGVREGWLYSQLSEAERYFDPLIEGAQTFATPLSRVPEFGPALDRWTASLFPGETQAEQRLRVAACALSDIGWRDHADLRAGEAFRRLVHFPFIGVDHAERVFLGAAIHARYSGAADDPALGPAIGLLDADTRHRAEVLGRAMQLGYRLSGGVPGILDGASLARKGQNLVMQVGTTARVPDSEVVSSRLQMLADALGAKPMIVEVA